MENSRRLRRELAFEFAKLNGLEQSVDLTLDDASTKALATEVRKQAGICLQLLDKYQLSMPSRMRSYSEGKCQRFREDLRRTEMRFRDASGEFERRILQTSDRFKTVDRGWSDLRVLEDALGGWDAGIDGEQDEECGEEYGEEYGEGAPSISHAALSRHYIDVQNDQDIEALMALVDDDVEFKLAFDPPLVGKAAVRRQYERDWTDHEGTLVSVNEVFEGEEKVAVEIHVDSGPPSNVLFNGVVVHQWNDEGRLTHYQLYVDEVTPAEGCP